MKKIAALVLTVVLLVCVSVSALAANYDLNEAKKSVVRIVTEYTVIDTSAADYGTTYYSTGSGFAVGRLDSQTVDYIVTAGHVVNRNIRSGSMGTPTTLSNKKDGSIGYVAVQVDKIYVLLDDIDHYEAAQFVQCLPEADVALLRLNTPTNLRRPAVLINKTEFAINEPLTTMGFPSASEHNLSQESIGDLISSTDRVSVNQGTFTTLDRHSYTHAGDQITTNAAMSSGVSGGPLLDNDGYVVGVCVAGSTESQNANYAITTGEVLKLLGSVNDAQYELGPISKGLSTTMLIIIAAAAVVIIALILLIIFSAKSKKNVRNLVFNGAMSGKTVNLKKGTPVVIGRDPSRCQVVYPKNTSGVSSVHCTITFDGTQVLVADNGSSYGTFVGGQKVEPGKPVVMHRGQEVTFGSDKNGAELH